MWVCESERRLDHARGATRPRLASFTLASEPISLAAFSAIADASTAYTRLRNKDARHTQRALTKREREGERRRRVFLPAAALSLFSKKQPPRARLPSSSVPLLSSDALCFSPKRRGRVEAPRAGARGEKAATHRRVVESSTAREREREGRASARLFHIIVYTWLSR